MIGMMNIGSHDSVEVYGSSRPSSIYDRNRISKDTRTYMEDGRVMLNGVPVRTATSDELWASMIRKMALRNMVIVEEKAGPLTKMFRRVSSKFRNTRKTRKSNKKEKSKKSKEQDLVIEQEQNDHITRIEIL